MRTLVFVALTFAAGAAWPQSAVVTPEDRLFAAIDEGKEIVAEGVLLRGYVNPDARNAQGETSLHRAVENGMKDLSRALAKAGFNLRARSNSGETVLHLAALHGDPALTEFLLGAGADPKARNDDGESPLHWAALSGNASVAGLAASVSVSPTGAPCTSLIEALTQPTSPAPSLASSLRLGVNTPTLSTRWVRPVVITRILSPGLISPCMTRTSDTTPR